MDKQEQIKVVKAIGAAIHAAKRAAIKANRADKAAAKAAAKVDNMIAAFLADMAGKANR